MEEIFYATLALHIAGKPITKEDIQAMLEAAGTPVDEVALDAFVSFVEALEGTRRREGGIDPRIVRFLAAELAQRKGRTQELEALFEGLSKSLPEAPAAAPQKRKKAPAIPKPRRERAAIAAEREAPVEELGRYVYGIVAGGEAESLGPIGLEGSKVYTIPYEDICAIVHDCPTEPYQSEDDEQVKGWIKAHQAVLDRAKERFGMVIPLGFDTVLQPQDETASPDQVVRDWLKADYERLRTVMERIRGKDEYGVQILYDPKAVGELVAEQSEEIKKLKEEMATKSPGLAYMYKQKLEKAVKADLDRLAEEWFKDFYQRIKRCADDVVVEKTKKVKDKVMLLNLSCLVAEERVEDLGEELERIDGTEGFSVRFTGPWPPYSFVNKPHTEGVKEGWN